jgi:hypothetical protein
LKEYEGRIGTSFVSSRLACCRIQENGISDFPMIRTVTEPDLGVGMICADRDGNRVRVDRIDHDAGRVAYHFLNDELRVQEGTQEVSIQTFLSEGWSISPSGKL